MCLKMAQIHIKEIEIFADQSSGSTLHFLSLLRSTEFGIFALPGTIK